MSTENHKALYQTSIFAFLIIIRLVSEILFKFGDSGRVITFASGGAILAISFLALFPEVLINQIKSGFYFVRKYCFVILYIIYLCFRTDFSSKDSLKMFLSESTVYLFFAYSVIYSSKSEFFYTICNKLLVLIFKLAVLIGLVQIAVFIYFSHPGLTDLVKSRPAEGFIANQNVYAVFLAFFGSYCLFTKKYLWMLLSCIAFLGAGNRSLILYFLPTLFICYLILKNKEVKSKHVVFTLLLIIVIWSILLYKCIGVDLSSTWGQDERMTAKTFVFRVFMWTNLWSNINTLQDFIFGKCLYESYLVCGKLTRESVGFPPHNDYLLLIYDTGFLGLMLNLGVALNFLKAIVSNKTYSILIAYICMIAYPLTGNLMFYSITLFLYSFIGLEIGRNCRYKSNLIIN